MNPKQATLDSFSVVGTEQEINIHGQVATQFRESYRSLVLLLSLCYAPVVLIWLKIIPFEYRFLTCFCALAAFACFCFYRQYSLAELGFRTDNLKSSLVWNLCFCVAGGIGLVLMHKAGFLRPKPHSFLPHIYMIYFFILGPAQELLFRGILFSEIKRITGSGNRFFLFISTFSFCLLHIIYNHPPLLVIALISGLVWGVIFIKKPNIWGVALSHSLLGSMAMALHLI
ncbi:CPBP family intramembrane glutamic endopeptidase [Desulfobacter curvatus]|uniref:CPBP family intramembrane glutamic endopeptidase n=1 Tax=Desulfobacter curvatus TaxID=2290 RepID=UPI00035C2391|nr:CPBP family intramembrane glutamic endopeptidase [Desulfobacter curvatus]